MGVASVSGAGGGATGLSSTSSLSSSSDPSSCSCSESENNPSSAAVRPLSNTAAASSSSRRRRREPRREGGLKARAPAPRLVAVVLLFRLWFRRAVEYVVHLPVEEPRQPPLPAQVVPHHPEGLLPRAPPALPLLYLLVVAGQVAPPLPALHGWKPKRRTRTSRMASTSRMSRCRPHLPSSAIVRQLHANGSTDLPFAVNLAKTSAATAAKEVCHRFPLSKATMAQHGRLRHIEKIAKSFSDLTMAHKGEVKVTVITVLPLPAEEEKELKETLQDIIGRGKTVKVEQKIDPSILGGLVVEFGQKVFDMSIKTRAKQMERFLREPIFETF